MSTVLAELTENAQLIGKLQAAADVSDAMPAEVTLAVLRHKDGWRVFGPAGGWRHFRYKVDAEEAALRLAHQTALNADGRVQVLVQEQWGELRSIEGL